ncbi:MAG TPA: hypothetical protein VF334_10195 [Polyangia bacterium]
MRADPASDARARYQRAQAEFAVGEFAKAADDYQAAYTLKPDPALLYDAAQSYRLAGNQERALILYKNYLQFYPNESNAGEVRDQIAKLKAAIAAAESAKNAPPTGTQEAKQPSAPAAAAVPSAPAPPQRAATSAESSSVPRERTPLYKKWWLWTAVGVVAVGVVTAVVLATTPSGSWNNAPEVGPGRMGLQVRW